MDSASVPTLVAGAPTRRRRAEVVIRLTTLGEIDLRLEDGVRANSVLQQPGRFALLVYLAMAGGSTVRRDTLLGLFWPDSPEDRARHRLSQAVYHLRRSLGRDVIHGRGAAGYGISSDALRCDAAEFLAAVEDRRLEEALEMYDGDFLPGFFAESAAEFERWMEGERRRLRRVAAEAALGVARGKLPADPVGAAAAARRGLELSPVDEPTVRRTMELLAEAGDRLGALEAYSTLQDRLDREFGAAPSPETAALVRAIREAEEEATARPPAVSGVSVAEGPEGDGGVVGHPPATENDERDGPRATSGHRLRGRLAAGVAAALATLLVVIGIVHQSAANPTAEGGVPRVFVQEVGNHTDLGTGMDLSRAVTTGTLANLAEVGSLEVLPLDPSRSQDLGSGPSVILRADLARSGEILRATALLLDAESLVTIGRRTGEFSLTEDLAVVDAVAAWLARFAREQAGIWMKDRRMHGSGATEATLRLIRSAMADRERADSLAGVGSLDAAGTLLGIADSVLARAEAAAPTWVEPRVQRAETALARMWLAFRAGAPESGAPREAARTGLQHVSRALEVSPGDPDAMAVEATLTYWLWQTTPPDSVAAAEAFGDMAEERLRRVVELDPTRARAWTSLSALLQARGAFAEARWAAERAYRADAYLDATGGIQARLFETALETGDLPAARRWCGRLAERGGRAVEAYCGLALLAWGARPGNEEVEEALTLRGSLGGDSPSTRRWAPRLDALMGVVLARAGRLQEAEAALQRARAGEPDPEVMLLHAWALTYMGEPEAARVLLDHYVAEKPHLRSGTQESRRFQGLWVDGVAVAEHGDWP